MTRKTSVFASAAAVCAAGIIMTGCVSEEKKDALPRIGAQIPLVSKAPGIDGKLDDKEWALASCLSGFITLENEWAREQTSVFLSTDGKSLFLAVRCESESPSELKAKKHPDDSMAVFGDESVEIFIAPDPARDTYYHLAINAAGSVYSAKCGKNGSDRVDSWNPVMKTATGSFAGGWILETEMDLASMGARAELGDKWLVNIARNSNSPSGRQNSSWTGQKDFNCPALFGECSIEKSGGMGFELKKASLGSVELSVRNAGETAARCEAAARTPFGSKAASVEAGPLSSSPLKLELPKGAKDDFPLTISVNNGEKTATIPFESQKEFRLAPALYYVPAGNGKLSVKVESLLANADKIKIAVAGPSSAKSAGRLTIKASEKSFALETKDMKPGRHVVSATVVDAKGKTLASDEQVVMVTGGDGLAPLPEKKEFSLEGRRVMLNGGLFFPFMCCHPPKGNDSPLAAESFNVDYGGIGIRKNAAKLGYCGYPSRLSREGGTHYEAPEQEKAFESMKTVIEKGVTENYLCRRIQYEAAIPLFRKDKDAKGPKDLRPLSPKDEYTDCHKFLKKTFPKMLTSIQNDRDGSLPEFAGCADIIEVATPSSYSKKLLRNFEADLASARMIVGDKPLLLWIGASIPSSDFRSAETLRAATWMAVFGGADGIVYHMGHDGIPEKKTRLWSVFKGLAREVETLHPIAAGGRPSAAGLAVSESPQVKVSAVDFQGSTYLIVMNQSASTAKARIKVAAAGFSDSCEVLFEGRGAKMKNGVLEDSLTSFEPRAYKLTRK